MLQPCPTGRPMGAMSLQCPPCLFRKPPCQRIFIGTAATVPIQRDSQMRILIVEDEDRIVSFLTKGLEANGHSTMAVGDGIAQRRHRFAQRGGR